MKDFTWEIEFKNLSSDYKADFSAVPNNMADFECDFIEDNTIKYLEKWMELGEENV